MNSTMPTIGERANLLLDYEWRMVLEALNRDMVREQGLAEELAAQPSTHGYNAAVIRRVLEILGSATGSVRDGAPKMTARERDIADLLLRKMTAKQIGRVLGISHRTVDVYRSRLLQKFKVRKTEELVALEIGTGRCSTGAAAGGASLSDTRPLSLQEKS